MELRKLGRTSLEVSAIGLGTEHLFGQSRDTVISVIRNAIDQGVNYFDVIFAMPEYLDNMGVAFRGQRDRVLLTAHLGSTEKDGQYLKSRSVNRCERFFHDYLRRLETGHVDVLFLHNFNSVQDWEKSAKPDGVLDLAIRLRREGKARFIGASGHFAGAVKQAIDCGQVDVIMFPVNLFNHALLGRTEMLDLCAKREIGLVAMKPFGGGKLLTKRGTLRVPKYQTSGEAFKVKIASEITPTQCLSYVLAQMGVSLALPGVKNEAELAAALQVFDTAETERDYSGILADFGRYEEGVCVYCNHCLPCPAFIDIGAVNRLLDAAECGMSKGLQMAYDALPGRASDCTECGACVKRCPFQVDVVAKIRQTASLFEPTPAMQQAGVTTSL
jgi:predicted aldo/keto reductase-like oxidoreductase